MNEDSHPTSRRLIAVRCGACEAQSVFTRDPNAGGLSDLRETHECPSCGAELTVTLPLESGQVLGYSASEFAAEAVDTAYREGLEKPASAKRVFSIAMILAVLYATADYFLAEPQPLRGVVVLGFGFVMSLFCIGAVLTMSQSGYLTRLGLVVRKELASDPAPCPACGTKTFRRGLSGEVECAACDKRLVSTPLLLVEAEGAVAAKEALKAAASQLAKDDKRLKLEPSRRDWILGAVVAVVVLMIIASPDWFGL